MPMFIPVVIAVAAGGGYIAMAGAVLTAVGALTNNKDLKKVGAILSVVGMVGGAISGLADGASGAAGAAEGAAEGAAGDAAGEAAGAAAGEGAGAAVDAGVGAAESAGDIANAGASAGAGAGDAASVGGAATGAGDIAGGLTPPSLSAPPPNASIPDVAAPVLTLDTTPAANASSLAVDNVAPNVTVDAAPAASMSAGDSPAWNYADSASGSDAAQFGKYVNDANPANISSPLQQWLDKIMGGVNKVGTFAKNNKELIQLGGQALQSAYGPQAEALDFQKSIYDRQQQNLNSPVRLYYKRS